MSSSSAENPDLQALGNAAFNAGDYSTALTKYSAALTLTPKAALYSNRAACHTAMSAFHEAVEDCRSAVRLDPLFAKAYFRMAKAYHAMGDFAPGGAAMACLMALSPRSDEAALKLYEQLAAVESSRLPKYANCVKLVQAGTPVSAVNSLLSQSTTAVVVFAPGIHMGPIWVRRKCFLLGLGELAATLKARHTSRTLSSQQRTAM